MNLLLSKDQAVCEDFLDKLAIAAVVISVDQDQFSFFAVNRLALGFYGLDSIPTGTGYTTDDFQVSASTRPDFTAYVERGLSNYRKVRDTGEPLETETDFTDSTGQVRWTRNFFTPLSIDGAVSRVLLTFTDVTELKKEQAGLEYALSILANEVSEVCNRCNKVRDSKGVWGNMKDHLNQQSERPLSHSICGKCMEQFKP
jgi:hypothetical protein